MTGKTIRVSANIHSTFFLTLKRMQVKSSNECLSILLIEWHNNHGYNSNLDSIYKGMYQIEEKS